MKTTRNPVIAHDRGMDYEPLIKNVVLAATRGARTPAPLREARRLPRVARARASRP